MDKRAFEGHISEEMIEWSKEIAQRYRRTMAYYKCAIMEIETKLNVLTEEFSLQHDRNPINGIKSRLKSLPSIQGKLDKKGLPFTLEAIEANLSDVAGVRVICSFIDDVYLIADALLKQDDITLIERKDYIQNPKPNGYRSLHLIVTVPIFLEHEKRIMKVELQLRTIAMDFWASLEHKIHYKLETNVPEYIRKELVECAGMISELDARMLRLNEEVQELSQMDTDELEWVIAHDQMPEKYMEKKKLEEKVV